ncbi:MAG TPA: Rieske 2Fe-2S domain-containing protein [Acidimicrobiia bacterium]|nr:Rieske 2Fe-2S domain-containing protein [Acidimicrobiia bacterium]
MSMTTRRVLVGRRSESSASLRLVEIDGHRIVLVDLGDELLALDDTCTHEDASLVEVGEVDPEAREIECCKHGARYSLDDGSIVAMPAVDDLHTYRVTVEGDDVYVEVPA